mgnify:CR=1 FL=1
MKLNKLLKETQSKILKESTMEIKINKSGFPINWQEEDKTFAAEASDLNLPARYWNSMVKVPPITTFILTNPLTNISKKFVYTGFEWMNARTKEEVGAWNYKNSETGIELIIFND